MVAYLSKADQPDRVPVRRKALSHDLFHGLSPEEFGREGRSLADAEAMTPQTRARIEALLIERLKTPVDTPSWGPDWVRRGERVAARHGRGWWFAPWIAHHDDAEADEEPDPLGLPYLPPGICTGASSWRGRAWRG